jgi:hypothetical protein
MAQGKVWTPELERFCEDACVSQFGASLVDSDKGNAAARNDALSVVYSVDIKDLSSGETEIGKSWVSYSVDDCSLVSRCPSRTPDTVFIEEETGSFPSRSASSCSLHSEAFDVPCLIYVRMNAAPEVPVDEPLEAILGIPFLRRQGPNPRRNKHNSNNRLDGPRMSMLRRTMAKIKSKATGRLTANNSECYKETLVDL